MVDSQGKEKTDGSEKEMPEPSLEEWLEGLKLQGEEEKELKFVGEFEELVKDVHWLALFRVHTNETLQPCCIIWCHEDCLGGGQRGYFQSSWP